MKVIAICNLPDGIKLDHAWFTAEDGLYAQKVKIKPLPERMTADLYYRKTNYICDWKERSCGWNECLDKILGEENES